MAARIYNCHQSAQVDKAANKRINLV